MLPRRATAEPSGWAGDALAQARPAVFWTDRTDAPEPAPPLRGHHRYDLAIVGGGFTGLWAALQAAEDSPGRRIVVLEGTVAGHGASSRNGGFCDASLTHGLHNGISHWPDEIETLVRLGRRNFAGLVATIKQHHIDAGFEQPGELAVATADWHVAELGDAVEVHRAHGDDVELLDAAATRSRVDSPTYLGGLHRRNDAALVDPARLAWGLRGAAVSLGVALHEHSPVTAVEAEDAALVLRTADGAVRADRVLLATNAYRGPLRRPRRYMVPVYDYVLVTEPLSAEQRRAVGWDGREGVGDVGNQFHYYRMTADDRILWGGYDAVYHFNNRVDPALDQSDRTHAMLAEHFFATFPQLEGLTFTHRWGGAIATTSRFTATWGRAHDGRLAWVGGYTGLGVAASRFGARVALDLLDGRSTERTELAMVRRPPFPFPPEPLRWPTIWVTRWALQRADRNGGRRGLWLRLLDRFGIGYDS